MHTGFGRQEVVEYLLDNGAKVDVQDDGGLMPLHNACSFGHTEVVQTLLKHGADPNARDNWNYTPLHEASSKGKIDVCIGKYEETGYTVFSIMSNHTMASQAVMCVYHLTHYIKYCNYFVLSFLYKCTQLWDNKQVRALLM